MKYLFPVLMAVAIFSGVLLLTTPLILEYFFPMPKESLQYAKPEEATTALKRWFNSPNVEIKHVHAARERLADIGINSYFTFETTPEAVKGFIRSKRLKQLQLTDEIMQKLFINPKINHWKPDELGRETYFTGEDKGILLYLIYNAERKQGCLLLQQ